ncbi:hypothetical protein KKC32_00945 [Patescibacteria group bacterium]|nr:hypothetical protein [Patescibacteria group bacterium]
MTALKMKKELESLLSSFLNKKRTAPEMNFALRCLISGVSRIRANKYWPKDEMKRTVTPTGSLLGTWQTNGFSFGTKITCTEFEKKLNSLIDEFLKDSPKSDDLLSIWQGLLELSNIVQHKLISTQ